MKKRIGNRKLQLTCEMLEQRCVLAAVFPAYVDGVFTLGNPEGTLPYGPGNSFLLESRPGAEKTIYLDFDGHHSVNNGWGHNIVFPAFDLNGDPTTFSDTELEEIQLTFQNVSEDYLPFDVNVTTKDPGVAALTKSNAADTVYGLRNVSTQPTDGFGNGIGGIAQFNIFDDSVDTPVFSFNKGSNVGAMTVSHEVGHGLGLFHDGLNGAQYHPGTGSDGTSWGPIMGAPFSANVTQWSNGDYTGATNTQDDITVITQPANGFGVRGDDYGDGIVDASPLATLGDEFFQWGVIEESSDQDAFSFTATKGTLLLDVFAFQGRPNLDVEASLLDAQGNLIAAYNPVTSPDATIMASVDAGDYFVVVDGVGRLGRYSDYGSLGLYTISGFVVGNGDFNADLAYSCQDVDALVRQIANQNSTIFTTLDDFESYSVGGLDTDQTSGVWRYGLSGTNPPAGFADDGQTLLPFLDVGTQGGNQFLTGTSAHGRLGSDPKPNARNVSTGRELGPATIAEGSSGTLSFDIFVTADDRPTATIGFAESAADEFGDLTGAVRIIPNRFDVAGTIQGDGVADTFMIGAKDGGTDTDGLITGLNVNQWYNIKLEIDTASNTYDVLLDDVVIADNFVFQNTADSDITDLTYIGHEHRRSNSPAYTDNDGIRLDNLAFVEDSARFDLNEDGVVDAGDLDLWLTIAGAANLPSGNAYLPADANLDGTVDGNDFLAWNSNKFAADAGWCGGDFNADGFTDGADFLIWNSTKFSSSDAARSERFELEPEPLPLDSDVFPRQGHDHTSVVPRSVLVEARAASSRTGGATDNTRQGAVRLNGNTVAEEALAARPVHGGYQVANLASHARTVDLAINELHRSDDQLDAEFELSLAFLQGLVS